MKKLCFTFVVLIGFAVHAQAYDFQAGDLLYTIISTAPPRVSLDGHIDGTDAQGELAIPEMVEYEGTIYTVTAIGERAFVNCNGLTGSLVIPTTIDTIFPLAFYNCSRLTGTLAIPNNAVLKNYVFGNCRGFTELIFPDTISIIPCGLFAGCSGLRDVLEIPETVKIIGEYAFYGCTGLSRLVLPYGLEEIHERAFKNCTGFTGTLDIPETVTYIKYGAFCNCSGFSGDLIIPNSVVELGTTLNDYWDTNEPPDASFASFADCFDHLVLSESLDSIGVFCFYECSRLSGDLVIPNSVRGICYRAFCNCSGFSSLTFGNSLSYIGSEAFYGCTGLRGTLVIPESVTTVKRGTFGHCCNLEHLILSPNMNLENYENGIVFSNCKSLVSIDIPEGWTSTGIGTFQNCTNLSSVQLPKSLKTIGEKCFEDCISLTEINIPIGVNNIGMKAFSHCSNLSHIVLPDSLTNLGMGAFYFCTSLSGELVIPDLVGTIDYYAFNNCTNISRIVLGKSVNLITEYAFINTNLESLVLKAMRPPEISFYPYETPHCLPFDLPITIPCGTLEAYQNAEGWSYFTNLQEGNTLSLSVVPKDETLGEAKILKEAICEDMSVEVEAIPANGSVFLYWEDNDERISSENPYSFEQTEDIELVAHFSGMGLDETEQDFSFYPNPTNDRVKIDGIMPTKVQVYNTLGQLIKTERKSNEINIGDLPQGLYFLNVFDEEGKKIVWKVAKE